MVMQGRTVFARLHAEIEYIGRFAENGRTKFAPTEEKYHLLRGEHLRVLKDFHRELVLPGHRLRRQNPITVHLYHLELQNYRIRGICRSPKFRRD